MLQPSFGIEKLMNKATNNEHHGVRMQHAHPCMHPMGSLSLNFNKSFSTHGISPFRMTKKTVILKLFQWRLRKEKASQVSSKAFLVVGWKEKLARQILKLPVSHPFIYSNNILSSSKYAMNPWWNPTHAMTKSPSALPRRNLRIQVQSALSSEELCALEPCERKRFLAVGCDVGRRPSYQPGWHATYRCFLKWWYPHFTPHSWSFLVGKLMVVGETHHFRKPP